MRRSSSIGDKLPSILSAQILALVSADVLDQLPLTICAHMVAHEDEKDIRALGKIADHYTASSGAAASFPAFTVAEAPQLL